MYRANAFIANASRHSQWNLAHVHLSLSQLGSSRGLWIVAVLRDWRMMIGQLYAPAALPPGKKPPVTFEYECGAASQPVWTIWRGKKSLFLPTGIESRYLACPVQSPVTIVNKKHSSFKWLHNILSENSPCSNVTWSGNSLHSTWYPFHVCKAVSTWSYVIVAPNHSVRLLGNHNVWRRVYIHPRPNMQV
jgi:hypothetical protein